jgi:hypothetical protein
MLKVLRAKTCEDHEQHHIESIVTRSGELCEFSS